MGIRGLTGWIHWAAAQTVQEPNWQLYSGKKVGIDILGLLYKAKAQRQSPMLYISRLIAACKKYNILPVPIFDGKPPEEKREALKLRTAVRARSEIKKQQLILELATINVPEEKREIVSSALHTLELNTSYFTSDERDLAKQLFYACGISSYNATGEADNVLAYFSKRGELAAVISNDFDLLTRGVETLLVPDSYALPGDLSGWKHYSLSTILGAAEFTYNQFVDMCVLMGCDYTVGCVNLQYRSAYWAIKYRGSLENTLNHYKVYDKLPYMKAIEILVGNMDTHAMLMGDKQWDKWACSGSVHVEPETLLKFRGMYLAGLDSPTFDLLGYNFCEDPTDGG